MFFHTYNLIFLFGTWIKKLKKLSTQIIYALSQQVRFTKKILLKESGTTLECMHSNLFNYFLQINLKIATYLLNFIRVCRVLSVTIKGNDSIVVLRNLRKCCTISQSSRYRFSKLVVWWSRQFDVFDAN